MWAGTTVRVWEGSGQARRCSHCRKPIVWFITEAGKTMPFDEGLSVREIVTHPVTRARYVILHRDDRHQCVKRVREPGSVTTKDRIWRKS